MSALTADRVEEVYKACLFLDEEVPMPEGRDLEIDDLPADALIAEGVLHTTAFHPTRIAEHKEEILEMLAELPHPFRPADQGGGGGWSFLNACMREDGEQWTGLHLTQEMLMVLGIAVGAVSYVLPRQMWSALPGGMPYFVVDLERARAADELDIEPMVDEHYLNGGSVQ